MDKLGFKYMSQKSEIPGIGESKILLRFTCLINLDISMPSFSRVKNLPQKIQQKLNHSKLDLIDDFSKIFLDQDLAANPSFYLSKSNIESQNEGVIDIQKLLSRKREKESRRYQKNTFGNHMSVFTSPPEYSESPKRESLADTLDEYIMNKQKEHTVDLGYTNYSRRNKSNTFIFEI